MKHLKRAPATQLISTLTAIAKSESINKSADTFRNYTLGIRRLKTFLEENDRADITLQEFAGEMAQESEDWC